MKKMKVKEILSLTAPLNSVTVYGWVKTKRSSKEFSFIEIYDGSCLQGAQVVVDTTCPNYHSEIVPLSTGSSIKVTGEIVESPGKGQKYEIKAHEIEVYNNAPSDYPLQKKRHSFEFLRDIAHLRPRTNAIGAVMRVRNSMSYAVHQFFQEKGFLWVHTPIITASDCEGAGEMFQVTTLQPSDISFDDTGAVDYSKDFFGKPAHLTVSGQLEAEIFATALSLVYTFGPTFRAEHSNTTRHLAEFWMVEPEMAFYTLMEDMDLAEEFVRYCVHYALDHNQEDLDFFNARIDKNLITTLENVAHSTFERITYTDAIAILEKHNDLFEHTVRWGVDIQTEHERYLSETAFKKPVIVYDYPRDIKAFYMKQNDDQKTVRAMDLLVPRIGELVGGSERENRYDVLLARIKEMKLPEENYWWSLLVLEQVKSQQWHALISRLAHIRT